MEARGGVPQDDTSAELGARLRRIHATAGVLAVAWLMAVAAGGLFISNGILADRLVEAATVAQTDTKATASLVERMFHELAAIPQVVSASQELRTLVRRYNEKEAEFASR